MKHLTVKELAPLIEKYNGNLAMVARKCGVARGTLYRHLERSPELRAALQDARETMVDHVESRLYDNALKGDTTAVIFFLKTQGRMRGYSEKLELDVHQGKRPQDMTDDELESYIASLSVPRFSGS